MPPAYQPGRSASPVPTQIQTPKRRSQQHAHRAQHVGGVGARYPPLPRSLRSWHAFKSRSSTRHSALPAMSRARNSHSTEKSKPGSVSSRLRTYFHPIRSRTAVAAWRSDRLSASWEQIREVVVAEDRPQGVAQAHAQAVVREGGLCDLRSQVRYRKGLVGAQRHRRHLTDVVPATSGLHHHATKTLRAVA